MRGCWGGWAPRCAAAPARRGSSGARWAAAPWAPGAAARAGCGGGSGEGLDANGRPTSGSGGSSPLTATFESIQQNVFTPVCTGCHAGAAAPVGLRLDEASSYALLVGVASGEVSSLQRVAPGQPDTCYLIQKLEGRAAVGARMPLGGPVLDDATIAVIRQWIAAGAQRQVQP